MIWSGNHKHNKQPDIVAIDFETTGLYPDSDRVASYAACRFRDGQIIDEIEGFVDTEGVKMHPKAAEVNGITPEDLEGAPSWPEVSKKLARITEGALVVAQRMPFDAEFWRHSDMRHGIKPVERPGLCTKVMAAAAGLKNKSKGLGHLVSELDVKPGIDDFYDPRYNKDDHSWGIDPKDPRYHRADFDTLMCGRVASELIERLGGYEQARLAHDRFCVKGEFPFRLNSASKALYARVGAEGMASQSSEQQPPKKQRRGKRSGRRGSVFGRKHRTTKQTKEPLTVLGSSPRCNYFMPIAKAYCVLSKGHAGTHRSEKSFSNTAKRSGRQPAARRARAATPLAA